MAIRVNIGCCQTPTKDWHNYDNSWSIRLARIPIVVNVLDKLGLLDKPQKQFISFAKTSNIQWADATRHIPEQDNSVEVLYTSHMLEHLDREEVELFLKEAQRVLLHGGIIRIAVPNIKYHIDNYLKHGDADNFIQDTCLTRKKPKSLVEKFKYLLVGDRNHQWMYDGNSLCKLLSSAGFKDARVMEVGLTMIPDPGNLNLEERYPESVFVEAINP